MKQTEAQFQRAVVEFARVHGWRCAHFRPARTSKGWTTPVSADGAGFPDLVLVRDRVVFVELKAEKGRSTAAQIEWAFWLGVAGGEYFLWRPSDWPEIERTLSRLPPATFSRKLRGYGSPKAKEAR